VAAVVTDASGLGGSLLAGSPTLPPNLVSRVQRVAGVSAAEGVVAGYAMPLGGHGHSVSSTAAVGISVPADPRLRPLTLRSGQWPSDASEVVVDATTAGELGLTPGMQLRVALAAGVRTFTVSGIAGFGSAGTIAGLSIVGFAPGTAAGLLGTSGRYSIIEVAGIPAISAADLADRIRAAVGPNYTVRTGAEQADSLASSVGSVASVIGNVVGAFAVIALIVAALLIANTFTITIAQRTRELALLRCVGASRSQTARLVLGEAALIGLCGGLAGLFGGIGLSAGLRAVLGGLGLPLPAAAPVIRAHTVVAALAVGLGVTVVAAGTAVLRAARSRPLAAFSTDEIAVDPRGPGWVRRTAAAITLLLGVFLLAVSARALLIALGSVLLLAGAGLAGPTLVRPLTMPARRLLSVSTGVCGRLAGQQMLRNPRRIVGGAGALAVAVATVTVVAALAATFSSSAALDVRRSLLADYVISAPAGTQAGLNLSLVRHIAQSPGRRAGRRDAVRAVSATRRLRNGVRD
jgi:putative ABC transport system permease protein